MYIFWGAIILSTTACKSTERIEAEITMNAQNEVVIVITITSEITGVGALVCKVLNKAKKFSIQCHRLISSVRTHPRAQ